MRITETVIACFKLEEMKTFYQEIFNIRFSNIKIPKGVIYESRIDDLKIVLCPANIAGIKAKDNRHQLTFEIDDLKSCIDNVEKFSGSLISELQEIDNYLQIAIRDVDDNSMILKESLQKDE